MTDDPRRRRRRRPRPAAKPAPSGEPAAAEPTAGEPPHPEPPAKRRAPRDQGERGLRDLVGSGRSMIGVDGALRGRDVNRPTDEDLAEAERDVVIVRRNWKPDARS